MKEFESLKVKKFIKLRRGQVALVVLVVSAVVMTLGLSLSKRQVEEGKIDADEELLKKAFNAAESGIDYYLGTGETGYTSPGGDSRAEVSVSTLGGGSILDMEEYTVEGKPELFWLVDHSQEGGVSFSGFYEGSSLEVCSNNSFAGSLVVSYFYVDGGVYKIKREGFNLGTVLMVNNFEDKSDIAIDSCGQGEKGVVISSLLEVGTIPLLLTVEPIFSGASLSLKGNADFPIQGKEIESVGMVTASDVAVVTRKVLVKESYQVPSFMLEAITARGSVLSD